MRELEIYNAVEYPKTILITGTGRAGKTTLCKAWASANDVEWIEEPKSLEVACYAYLMGSFNESGRGINKTIFEDLWGLDLRERINDIVLGRFGLNFRPGDMSSAWDYKDVSNLFDRLINLNSRDDVQEYIRESNPIFLVDIPDMIWPFTELDGDKFNSLVLLVIRDPLYVALDTEKKEWFSDKNLIQPLKGNDYTYPYYKNGTMYRMPFWLEEKDAEEFLFASGYGRGLLYWLSLYGTALDRSDRIDEEIRYEDMLHNSAAIVKDLCDKYGGLYNGRTEYICSKMCDRTEEKINRNIKRIVSAETYERILKCCERWNYSIKGS